MNQNQRRHKRQDECRVRGNAPLLKGLRRTRVLPTDKGDAFISKETRRMKRTITKLSVVQGKVRGRETGLD